MALVLNYTTASSNLPAFLDNWTDNFQYRGNGWFNAVRNISDQWYAGTPIVGGSDNGKSSVIVNGDDFSYTPGIVDGAVSTFSSAATSLTSRAAIAGFRTKACRSISPAQR